MTKRIAESNKQNLKAFPDSFFSAQNGVQSNGCYLVENCEEPPYIRPTRGWKIIGYGKAPWPGMTEGFAVVLEKTTPQDDEHITHRGEDFPIGTRLWQHYRERWIKGE